MAHKDDLYIAILKFGKSIMTKGTKFSSLKEHLKSKGYKEEEKHWRSLFYDVFSGLEGTTIARLDKESDNDETLSFMQMDAYFRLLEHEELKSARKSSLLATYLAIIAIVISIIVATPSIHYSKQQINSSVTFEQLKSLKFDQDVLNSKLDMIISNTSIELKQPEKINNTSPTNK